ncbi:MAG: OmpA family protein [Terriglobia bacterium]|jgi:outer membrane protein OmpA-like peptidoglycan-associated protein
MALFNLDPDISRQPPSDLKPRGPEGRSQLWGWLLLVLMAVLVFFFVRALRQVRIEVAQLNQHTEEMNRRLSQVEQRSQTEAQQAAQAAQSAQAAAHQRDQADAARAESQNEAQKAQQQAAVAKQEASQAEQTAQQYRQQREQELAHLKDVLSHIADTRRTAGGLVVTLGSNSIRFDFDKSDIKPQYREILSRIAGVLMSVEGYSISVYGYTDDIGTADYNQKLSGRRAQAVRDYLAESGVDPKIITSKGYGKSDPRAPGDSASAHATNRRVEIGIVDTTIRLAGPAN